MIYVEELIGPETVNTMPRETIEAFEDHGRLADTLEDDVDGARRTLERFGEAGIDVDDVIATLEREGVEKFADSFTKLLDGRRREARQARRGSRTRHLPDDQSGHVVAELVEPPPRAPCRRSARASRRAGRATHRSRPSGRWASPSA